MHALLPLLLALILQKPDALPPTGLVVNWWTTNDITAMVKPAPDCGKEPRRVEPFTATLLICPGRDPSAPIAVSQSQHCKAMEPRPLSSDDRAGSIIFSDIQPGAHLIRFVAGTAEPIYRIVRVYEGEVREEHVDVRWPTIYGKVTKDGEPFYGRVFDTGVSDPKTGSYVATVTYLPLPTGSVEPCDGSRRYLFVAEPSPVENAAYDIEIPSNRLEVEVVDAESGQPIKDARVSYGAVKDAKTGSSHFAASGFRTDEEGRAVITPVVAKRKLRVCGRHEDYENSCSDEITLTATEKKQHRLPLVRIAKREGRVATRGKSWISWHAADGSSEETVTDDEGRFTYKRPHAPGEIVTVSSAVGFYVFPQPPLEKDEVFEIRPPLARPRTFEVHLSKTSNDEMGFFTIALGDLIVPHAPLAEHIFRVEQQAALKPGWTTVVTNVLETAPISVIYAGTGFLEPRMPNWWLVPEARTLPRRALGGESRVIFD